MTKSKGIINLDFDVSKIVNNEKKQDEKKKHDITIDQALEVIIRQMEVSGYRERTINDYKYYVNRLKNETSVVYLSDITINTLYDWLGSMDVKNETKLIRLKCIKAVLGKCFDNGWYQDKFWRQVNVKIDNKIKKGAEDDDIKILLSLIDTTTYIGFRDYLAISVLYQSGIRINTLALLESRHVDFENRLLLLDGSIMKNHKALKIPINEKLCNMLQILMQHNEKIRNHFKVNNDYVFINQRGNSVKNQSTNAITKQLAKYSKKYGLKNINPHAIRRGYAKNLLNRGASVALISKALGHSNLDVTTQYLSLDIDEIADSLRDYL